jgi:tetratricopeptide (TPR) repeat protein
MKKLLLLLPIIFLSVRFVSAQTQADIDKMMKQAQDQMKKYSSDTSVSKVLKNLQDKQNQVSDAMKNRPTGNAASNGSAYPDPSEYGNADNWKFPAKNITTLSSLPKKIFTKAELVSFLNDTYTQLAKKLPAGIGASVQSIAAKYNNNGTKMEAAAVSGWYTNYREESILLIIKAAANDPGDGLLLNNCAAILNMGGIEQRAIPILRYLLQSTPGSSMVLNNLGQAYAGLGDTDTAMYYLGRCIKIEPENPEANNTAGQIEATKGNIEKAVSYFEQSIKGGYNKPAALKLHKIKPNVLFMSFVKPRVKIPEYFNQYKYRLPAQCTATNKADVAKAEHEAFREMIVNQLNVYGGKLAAMAPQLTEMMGKARIVKKDEFIAQPFHELCGIMAGELLTAFTNDLVSYDKKYYASLGNLEKEYQDKHDIIKKEYEERSKAAIKNNCCGEGNTSCCIPAGEECKAYNKLADQYLPQFAAITEDWQEKNQAVLKKYFDQLIYWHYLSLHPISDDAFKRQYYELIVTYLGTLGKIGITKIIEPCHFEPTTAAAKDSLAIPEVNCPMDIEIPFIVGKFEVNCEKFSFKAGEGAVFGYEKNFKTHQSTVSVGIGLTLEAEVKAGPIKVGASASASESLFISFDGENKFSDGGLKFDAKASAGIEGDAGTSIKGKQDILKEETGFGYKLGICSGWNFNEGPFKGMLGPAAAMQINKNVKTF